MVFLASLNNPRMLQAFADYLSVKGIASDIRHQQGSFELWLQNEQDLVIAKQEWNQFIKDPGNEKYLSASWQRNDTGPKVFRYASNNIIEKQFLAHAGALTLAVFMLCWALFLLRPMLGYELLYFPRTFPDVSGIQWLNIVTPAFIHFSLMHILFNTVWWWYLGGMIENRLSANTLFTLLLITGVAANVAQFYDTGTRFGGLSGVVYGLTGFVWLMGVLAPHKGLKLPPLIFALLIIWMLLGYAEMLWVNVANSAHLVGLICGLLLALLYSEKWKARA